MLLCCSTAWGTALGARQGLGLYLLDGKLVQASSQLWDGIGQGHWAATPGLSRGWNKVEHGGSGCRGRDMAGGGKP